ncbi:MAG: hypothetical protein LBH80_08455 [Prevotellaceae bacterium]|jgi:hypothetical protein|nr:hypothetical protein [Prevotellaceae bacterium]
MKDTLVKITNILALVLIIISVVLVLWMYLGGIEQGRLTVGAEEFTIPVATNPLLYWTYILLIAAVVVTLFFAIWKFAKKVATNPKSALKTIIPLVIFVLVFIIAWSLGTDERISIIGYEGTQNEGFWAQLSDMFIYSIYILLAGLAVTILGSRIYVALK